MKEKISNRLSENIFTLRKVFKIKNFFLRIDITKKNFFKFFKKKTKTKFIVD